MSSARTKHERSVTGRRGARLCAVATIALLSVAARDASGQTLTIDVGLDGGRLFSFESDGALLSDGRINYEGILYAFEFQLEWSITTTAEVDMPCEAPRLYFAVRITNVDPAPQRLEVAMIQSISAAPECPASLRASVGAGFTAASSAGSATSVGGAPIFQASIDDLPVFQAYAGASLNAPPFESVAFPPVDQGEPGASVPAPQSSVSLRFLVDLTAGVGLGMSGVVVALPLLSPDLNDDGVVDGIDLGLLLSGWGPGGQTDLNGDGMVDAEDLALLLANWS